ncbi:MAG: lysophospholipase [Lachnospiraceae bacterium]|nr:lysophospholipase [Lachnospiraceae bacterium]
MRKEYINFDSRDGKTQIAAVRWIPDGEVKGILQIVHGMAEYVERYEDFARFLTEKGILVTGDDHLGHGRTVTENGALQGYFCEKDPATVVVRDIHRLKKLTQEAYPGKPYFLLGHSMGSFIARNYLIRYGKGIDGAIIMGTGMQPKGLVAAGKCMAGLLRLFQGSKKESKLLDNMSFGTYLDHIPNHETQFDWLSRNKENVQKYIEDPMCGFLFTINGFQTLLELVNRLHDKDNLLVMPRTLPIFFVAGAEDPVGEYGKAVERVYQSFLDIGMTDVAMKLYENDRHEILNEVDKETVYEDLYQWITEKMKRA